MKLDGALKESGASKQTIDLVSAHLFPLFFELLEGEMRLGRSLKSKTKAKGGLL